MTDMPEGRTARRARHVAAPARSERSTTVLPDAPSGRQRHVAAPGRSERSTTVLPDAPSGRQRHVAAPGRSELPTRSLALSALAVTALAGCAAVVDQVTRTDERLGRTGSPGAGGTTGSGSTTSRAADSASSGGQGRGTAATPAGVVAPPAAAAVDSGFPDRDSSFAGAGGGMEPAKAPQAGRTLSGPATAAEAANPTESAATAVLGMSAQEHLLRRATFGVRPQDRARLAELGIDAWLAEQLDPDASDPEGDEAWGRFPLAGASPAQVRGAVEEFNWDAMTETAQATLGRQLFGRRQLFEVAADVLGNVLHVPQPFDGGWDVGPTYHRDVIRAHTFGRYEDMLLAAMRHPAMLRYLSNDESRKESVNENLGRELLELHTVGVGSKYTETDVRNSAYLLTGRTVGEDGGFMYEPGRHWTGAVQVLDFTAANESAEEGLELGDEYLRYLARHPATAQRVSRAIAVRFVADDPPAELVDRLAAVFTESETAVLPVLEALFSSTEFWEAIGTKTRRPLESVVGAARAIDVTLGDREGIEGLFWRLSDMGHAPLAWPAPNGFPDVTAAWSSAGAVLGRWNTHRGLVGGWWDGLTTPEAASLVGTPVPATYGAYLDQLVLRITGAELAPAARDALLAFLDVTADAAVPDADLEGMAVHVAPLVLDSAYAQLR